MFNGDVAFGHNVNHWFEGNSKEEQDKTWNAWNSCKFNETVIDQSEPFYTTAQFPNYIFDTSSVPFGTHYFACGLGYNEPYPQNQFHCNRGVKAQIKVVKEWTDCDMHHFEC